jgi:hypothetical protein
MDQVTRTLSPCSSNVKLLTYEFLEAFGAANQYPAAYLPRPGRGLPGAAETLLRNPAQIERERKKRGGNPSRTGVASGFSESCC